MGHNSQFKAVWNASCHFYFFPHHHTTVPRLLPITHLPIGLLSSDFYPSHFYPSRLLPITGLSSKKDFYPLGHSPIRTFTHLFYFKHHKQRSKKMKLNPSLSPNKYCILLFNRIMEMGHFCPETSQRLVEGQKCPPLPERLHTVD